MKITLEELQASGVCKTGYYTFKESHITGEATLLEALESNGLDDVLRYLDNTSQLSDEQKQHVDEWARNQALKVAYLIESPDKDLIVNFLKTGEDREAAREVARAAGAAGAARVAGAAAGEVARAAWAAWAARAAAWEAAWASEGAERVARAAAWAAAWASEGAAREEQVQELKELFKRWEASE